MGLHPTFDLPHHKLGFDPLHKADFRCFFSVGTGWGTLAWERDTVSVTLTEGYLELCAFDLRADVTALTIDGRDCVFTYDGGTLSFERQTVRERMVMKIR